MLNRRHQRFKIESMKGVIAGKAILVLFEESNESSPTTIQWKSC